MHILLRRPPRHSMGFERELIVQVESLPPQNIADMVARLDRNLDVHTEKRREIVCAAIDNIADNLSKLRRSLNPKLAFDELKLRQTMG